MAEKRNVLRYLLWRGDLTFEADHINPVDALIFSIISYANLDFVNRQNDPGRKYTIAMLPEELKRTEREEGNYGPKQFAASVKKLIQMAADSKRFRDVTIRCFQSILNDEVQMQFAAVAFELPGQAVFLAFRGTDASLVGWKEDLNMSFTNGIPSQIAARLFAEQVIANEDRHLFWEVTQRAAIWLCGQRRIWTMRKNAGWKVSTITTDRALARNFYVRHSIWRSAVRFIPMCRKLRLWAS